MSITIEEVKHIALLSRLEFKETELEKFTQQLGEILDYVEMLNQLDTENISPTSHVLKLKNVMREDKTQPSYPQEDILKNAPEHEQGLFEVPTVIEEIKN